MSGLNITDLPPLPREWNPAFLPRATDPDDPHVGWDEEMDRVEDSTRGHHLVLASCERNNHYDNQAALELALRLTYGRDQPIPDTAASKAQTSVISNLVGGHLWRLSAELGAERVATATTFKRGSELPMTEWARFDLHRYMNSIRTEMNRAGAGDATGCALGAFHCELEPSTGLLKPHMHWFAIGEMCDVFDALRHRRDFLYSEGDFVPHRVRISRKPLTHMPIPATYLYKGYFTNRWVGPVGKGDEIVRARNTRLPEPLHTQVLLWFDGLRFKDMTLMMGMRVTRDGFRLTRSGTVHG